MASGPNSLSAASVDLCGVIMWPQDCTGRHIDLIGGDPVSWDDPYPDGGLSGVATVCQVKNARFEPVTDDDAVVAEGECDEFTREGGTKYFEGDWTFSRTDRAEVRAVMGLDDVLVDATTRAVLATAPAVIGSRCGCGAGSCAPRFGALFISNLSDIQSGVRTPTLDDNDDPLYRYQFHPRLRAISSTRIKTLRADDSEDSTVTVRCEAGPAFLDQLRANPPAWFASDEAVDLRTGAAVDMTDPDAAVWADRPFIDFFSPSPPPSYFAAACRVEGWINAAPVV